MFGIPWRLIVGVIVGAVIVKESRRANEYYESAKKRVGEAARKAKASWTSERPPKDTEPGAGCPETSTADSQ